MAKPTLSWFPVSRLREMLVEKTMTPEEWLRSAKDFGLGAVEMYYKLLGHRDLAYVEKLARTARNLGLEISMVTCSPDFTNPDPEIRRQQRSIVEMHIENSHLLGAPLLRVTAGQRHPGVREEQGVRWVIDSALELEGFASKLRIGIALENHFRDRIARDLPDFAARTDVFLKIYEELRDTPILINYDCASPIASGDDPIVLLKNVIKDIAHVHAGDWSREKGDYVPVGEGDVPFDEVFSILAASGFSGHISVMDGAVRGDEGLRRSIEFLQSKIDQYWAD